MVMFGALGKRRGPFDPPEYGTPGIGADIGAPPMADPGLGIPMPQAPVAAAMDKPKFGAWDAVGAIGDGLQALGGGQGTYLPLLLRQNQERQRAAEAAEQAQAERNDWLWKETWKRDNPAPVNNDTVNDYNFILKNRGKEAADGYLDMIASGPPIAVDVAAPDGSVSRTMMNRSSIGKPSPGGPAPGAVVGGYSFKGGDPKDRSNWVPVGQGGQGSATPGTFP